MREHDDAVPVKRSDWGLSPPCLGWRCVRDRVTSHARARAAQGRHPTGLLPVLWTLSADGVVEALDVVEHVRPGGVAGSIDLAPIRSVFRDEKKLSIAALSQTLPERLVEQVTPFSASNSWKCWLVYWLP
jgi:hypothetical protein